jgi:penicillin-binding protein 2
MGYLIVEKYLTDSLRAERVQEADRIANANLLPSFLSRQQFIEDSIRAFQWFKMTKDSSYIEKYISDNWNEFSPQPQKQKPLPAGKERETSGFAIIVNEREVKKKIQPALIS